MRKVLVTLTVVALIISILGTGLAVYFEAHTPVSSSDSSVSGE